MMEDHLVAYFDLLGFSDVVQDKNNNLQDDVLYLLKQLAENVGNFKYHQNIEQTHTEHTIRPAITAFSDDIVYSFPINDLDEFNSGPVIFYLAEQVASIFNLAVQLGLLIRGGISVGPLYHKDNVIFGCGLIDAYQLETKYAKVPRILIDDSAMKFIKHHPYVRPDDDGLNTLNYITAAYNQVGGNKFQERARTIRVEWYNFVVDICRNKIIELENLGNQGGLTKWTSFLCTFEKLLSSRI